MKKEACLWRRCSIVNMRFKQIEEKGYGLKYFKQPIEDLL